MQYMSPEHKNIFGALIKLQKHVKTIPVNAYNGFHKSNYATLDQCLDHYLPLLLECDLFITQTVGVLESGQPCLVTTLCHISGEWIKSTIPLFMKDQGAQALGASITYARRYGFLALIAGRAAGEDDDGNAASIDKQDKTNNKKQTVVAPQEPPAQQYISNDQFKELLNVLDGNEAATRKVQDYLMNNYKTKNLKQIPANVYDIVLQGAKYYVKQEK